MACRSAAGRSHRQRLIIAACHPLTGKLQCRAATWKRAWHAAGNAARSKYTILQHQNPGGCPLRHILLYRGTHSHQQAENVYWRSRQALLKSICLSHSLCCRDSGTGSAHQTVPIMAVRAARMAQFKAQPLPQTKQAAYCTPSNDPFICAGSARAAPVMSKRRLPES